MKIKLLTFIISILLGCTIANAQFADFLNYPLTVTPHESPDSTRGHFWGYMFGNYYDKLHADSGRRGNTQYSNVPQGANAFSLQRIYLGYDYFFNKQFSVHVVIAHEENADNASVSKINVDANDNRSFYLKYANMEWQDIFKGSRLSVGAITTPSFAITEEPFWGYRSIDRTIMDMKGITGSNDMGANLGGKIWRSKDADGKENACLGYNIMVGNGLGAVPDNAGQAYLGIFTVWKKYYGDLYVKMLKDKLVLDIYGDGRTLQWTPFNSNIITGRIFLGYKTKNFNIGAEYFQQIQKNMAVELSGPGVPVGGDTTNNTQEGFSIIGAAVLMRDKKTGNSKLSLFARYDFFNPNVHFNPQITYGEDISINNLVYTNISNSIFETYFVLGFDFQPIKQIHFMPNIWYDGIHDRFNYTSPAMWHPYDYDFVARITFYYQFFKN